MPRPFAVGGAVFFCTLTLLFFCDTAVAVAVFGVLCVLFIMFMAAPSTRRGVVLPCSCLFAAAACVLFVAQTEYRYKPALEYADTRASVEGRIVSLPLDGSARTYYILKTSSVDGEPVEIKIRLSVSAPLDAQPYDRLTVSGNIYKLGGDGDAHNSFKADGIYLGMVSFGDEAVTPAESRPPYYYILKLRAGIKSSLSELLPGENGALLIGMLIGDKSGISSGTLAAFRETGLSHLLAVSGLHMSIWAFSVYDFLMRFRLSLRLSPRLVALLTAAFAVFFMALTGFSPSCVRSGIMMLVLLAGKLAGRRADSLNSLGLALLLICFVNPFEAGGVPLWLSFLATLGLILMRGRLCELLERPAKNVSSQIVRKPVGVAARVLSLTGSAMIFTMPVGILCFGRVSLIAPAANLMDFAAASAAMLLAGLAAIAWLVPFCSFIAYPLAFAAGGAANYILFTVDNLSRVPYAAVPANDDYILLWLGLSFVLLAAAVFLIRLGHPPRRVFGLTAVCCAFMLAVGVASHAFAGGSCSTLRVCDVGNGTAVIASRDGKSAVIGCGGDYYTYSIIYDRLLSLGGSPPELIFVPRMTGTESSAADAVLTNFGASSLVLTDENLKLEYIAAEESIPVVVSRRGARRLWDGAELEYLCSDDASAAHLTLDGVRVLFIFYPGAEVSSLPESWLDADILVCRRDVPRALRGADFIFTAVSSDDGREWELARKNHSPTAATCGRGDLLFTIFDGRFNVERTK